MKNKHKKFRHTKQTKSLTQIYLIDYNLWVVEQ